MPPIDWLQFISSFLLVVGLLAFVLWFMKRSQMGPKGLGRQIEHLESFSVGPRQKLVMVRVRDQDLLIGVSPQEITKISEWPADRSVAASPSPVEATLQKHKGLARLLNK
ncbi:MAG: Flagellar protein FliO [Pseudomonadota bacterium]|jgi:flagellar protein FliO/FliZ